MKNNCVVVCSESDIIVVEVHSLMKGKSSLISLVAQFYFSSWIDSILFIPFSMITLITMSIGGKCTWESHGQLCCKFSQDNNTFKIKWYWLMTNTFSGIMNGKWTCGYAVWWCAVLCYVVLCCVLYCCKQ